MTGLWKLGAMASVLATLTACLQFDYTVTLRADGGGSFSNQAAFGEMLVRMASTLGSMDGGLGASMTNDFPHKPKGSVRRSLEAAGFTGLSVDAKRSKKDWHWNVTSGFSQPQALPELSQAIGGAVPTMNLFRLEDGSYLMVWKPGSDSDHSASGDPKPDMSPDEMQKLMSSMDADIGDLMAEMASFSMQMRVNVPGEVVSFDPSWGRVEGQAVVWSMDSSSIMQLATQAADADSMFPDNFRIRFRMDGAELPADVLSPASLMPSMGELI